MRGVCSSDAICDSERNCIWPPLSGRYLQGPSHGILIEHQALATSGRTFDDQKSLFTLHNFTIAFFLLFFSCSIKKVYAFPHLVIQRSRLSGAHDPVTKPWDLGSLGKGTSRRGGRHQDTTALESSRCELVTEGRHQINAASAQD